MSADWKLPSRPPALRRRYLAEGHWDDATLGAWTWELLRAHPQRELRVWSQTRPARLALGQAHEAARRLAGGLRARGIGAGDVVAVELPNWAEVAVSIWAAGFLGAVIVPVVHFYAAKELGFILAQSGARALITADRFGSLDYLASLEQIRPGLPALELVAVVGRAPLDAVPFERLLESDPLEAPARVDPEAPALVGYTSGTTADPKGVIHTHRSFLAGVRQDTNGVPDPRPYLTGSPISHVMGMVGGFLYPLAQGKSLQLIDRWEPAQVLRAMREADAVFNWGPPYFLTSLLDAPELQPDDLGRLRFAGLGGAPVPDALAERLEKLGVTMLRGYGSTEQLTLSVTPHDAPAAKRLRTDGRPPADTEVRLLDDAGRPVPPGAPGEIHSRSPRGFAGYTDFELSRRAVDADGWYASGDIAVADADGYLRIVDRKQDIIIRGGENISAAEVEDLLLRLPGVLEAALVAAPDARLGEHGCAFLRLAPGTAAPALPELQAFLERAGLGRKKWPEELRLVEDFPRTPSGKIRKHTLRAGLRAEPRR
jgi:acyl-CoA synthetase (AMP-forming)/AMP-acid ligase II